MTDVNYHTKIHDYQQLNILTNLLLKHNLHWRRRRDIPKMNHNLLNPYK